MIKEELMIRCWFLKYENVGGFLDLLWRFLLKKRLRMFLLMVDFFVLLKFFWYGIMKLLQLVWILFQQEVGLLCYMVGRGVNCWFFLFMILIFLLQSMVSCFIDRFVNKKWKLVINGNIFGFFFNGSFYNKFKKLLIFLYFGNQCLIVNFFFIVNVYQNIYFVDFYCYNLRDYYVMLVVVCFGFVVDCFC